MNKALVLVMCDVLVLSAMSLSSGTFSSSGLSGNDTDSKSFTKKEIDDAEVERGLLTNKLHAANAQVTNLLEELRNVTNLNVQLEKEKEGFTNKLHAANAQVTNLFEEVRNVTNLNAQLKKEREGLTNKLDAANTRVTKLVENVDKLKADNEDLKKAIEDINRKLHDAIAGKKNAIAEVDALTNKLNEAQEKIKSIDDAEQKKRNRIDRMFDSIGRIKRVKEGEADVLGNGLIVHTENNGKKSWFLLTHKSFIKTKKLAEIKISVGSQSLNSYREYSAQSVYSFKDGGEMRLLAFNPPGEIFSFRLGTDEWRREIYEDSALHIFRVEKGVIEKKSIAIKPDGVEVKINADTYNSDGDVLISTITGRVSFRYANGIINRSFLPIRKIELEKDEEVK